ncbi:MAG: putative ABC transporter ATP-binding protein YknY [Planctomycetes bacterium]|nr:putative ABC transporter ATP-binding protein YknY [Planctomycetota bacterium]
MPLVELRDVEKRYGRGAAEVAALRGVTMDVERGEFVAVLGRSGSGKSTLMNLLAGLDRPTSGTIRVDGRDLSQATPAELAAYRARTIGVVFQQFHLLPGRTAAEQVALPLVLDETPPGERAALVAAALDAVGLSRRATHVPAELSGGEQQRVAVARAVVRKPPLLLCDEPTGNLDSVNAEAVVDLLSGLRARLGCTVVMITHEPDLADRVASRRVRMEDGRIAP